MIQRLADMTCEKYAEVSDSSWQPKLSTVSQKYVFSPGGRENLDLRRSDDRRGGKTKPHFLRTSWGLTRSCWCMYERKFELQNFSDFFAPLRLQGRRPSGRPAVVVPVQRLSPRVVVFRQHRLVQRLWNDARGAGLEWGGTGAGARGQAARGPVSVLPSCSSLTSAANPETGAPVALPIGSSARVMALGAAELPP